MLIFKIVFLSIMPFVIGNILKLYRYRAKLELLFTRGDTVIKHDRRE